jgi:hypothetical protein
LAWSWFQKNWYIDSHLEQLKKQPEIVFCKRRIKMTSLINAVDLKSCLIPSPGLRPPSPGGRRHDYNPFYLGNRVGYYPFSLREKVPDRADTRGD